MTRRGKSVEEAWSHLYWGGVVVVVALEPGLLPVGHQVKIIIEKKISRLKGEPHETL